MKSQQNIKETLVTDVPEPLIIPSSNKTVNMNQVPEMTKQFFNIQSVSKELDLKLKKKKRKKNHQNK